MEKIYNLPVDKIPLSNEEKDVFQWLYPSKEETNEIVEKDSKQTKPLTLNSKKYQYYTNIICMFVLIFCAVYPKCNSIWKKFIPTNEESVLFSVVKVFTIFFILYFLNYIFLKYK